MQINWKEVLLISERDRVRPDPLLQVVFLDGSQWEISLVDFI